MRFCTSRRRFRWERRPAHSDDAAADRFHDAAGAGYRDGAGDLRHAAVLRDAGESAGHGADAAPHNTAAKHVATITLLTGISLCTLHLLTHGQAANDLLDRINYVAVRLVSAALHCFPIEANLQRQRASATLFTPLIEGIANGRCTIFAEASRKWASSNCGW